MSTELDGAVELLERSLSYTRVALGGVDESASGNLDHPTPCPRWDLAQLLAHLHDSLDAFTGAATGVVAVHPMTRQPTRVDVLREKTCALLGAWLAAPAHQVGVGGAGMSSCVLVATAALEITVHGWDIASATGQDLPVPLDLAAELLGPARRLVGPSDRISRFGPLREAPGRSADVQLLAYLGRGAHGHPGSIPLPDGPGGRIAS